jgi:hypothetical protein
VTSVRLGGRSTRVAIVAAAATAAGLLGIAAGAAALTGSTTTAGGGAVVPIVGILAISVGLAAFALAVGTWLSLPWARPLGVVVAPAFGAIAVIDGLFAAGGLLGPVPVLGVALAAVILVGITRPGEPAVDGPAADDRADGDRARRS